MANIFNHEAFSASSASSASSPLSPLSASALSASSMEISELLSPRSVHTPPTSSTISTPQTSRRTSFLSQKMINNETSSIYDSYTFTRGVSSYHIISLKESQGFLFNQDLFASTYQQSRTLLREKQVQVITSKRRSHSLSHSGRSKVSPARSQRRHTTYGQGPMLRKVGDDSAVDETSDDDMCVDEDLSGAVGVEGDPPATLAKAFSFSGAQSLDPHRVHSSRGSGSKDIHISDTFDPESDGSDGESEDEGSYGLAFAPIGSNYVPVIDISVDDMDHIPDI